MGLLYSKSYKKNLSQLDSEIIADIRLNVFVRLSQELTIRKKEYYARSRYIRKEKQTKNQFLVGYVELFYIWELDRLNITVMMDIVL